jgi:hypothetical protein
MLKITLLTKLEMMSYWVTTKKERNSNIIMKLNGVLHLQGIFFIYLAKFVIAVVHVVRNQCQFLTQVIHMMIGGLQ